MQRWIGVVVVAIALGGCATRNHMAFDADAKSVDTSRKSVVLLAIEVSRDDNSRFVPVPSVVKLERPGAQSKEERQNFVLDEGDDSIEEGGHRLYLARMALEPGPYMVGEVDGRARAFPITGTFIVPLLVPLDVPPGSIVYAGHVTAKLRWRREGEFRAGPVLPLIDQAIAGLSEGTWDVVVDDRADRDIALFRDRFDALRSATIETRPLPPFDRARAQRKWDGEADAAKAAP
jgi:hypothetical protein